MNAELIFMGKSKKKELKNIEKKYQKWPSKKKMRFSTPQILNLFFAKILGINPCVCRINKCEG